MISNLQARVASFRKPGPQLETSKKPVGLIYGRDDLPPLATTIVLGLQHAAESASKIALPAAVLLTIGAPPAAMETMIAATLLSSGLCCLLVASKARPFGYGYLAPAAIMSSFVGPSLLAAKAGGLPLVAGLTLVTGTIVVLLSHLLYRWRFLFPPEVVGLIAFMVGASQATLAVSRFVGLGDRVDQTPDPNYLLVAAMTLGLLATLTVWGKGRLRLFSSLITILFGYGVAARFGFIASDQWARVRQAALLDFPRIHPPGFSIDATLLLPFIVLGLSAAMKAAGDLSVCEKISDSNWKHADLKRSRSALLTYGLGTMMSSMCGGFAVMSSSSNIGLSAATGATSRYINYACGAILIGLAFLPKVVALIAIVPPPVAGAMFLLVVSYNLIAGMQIIMSRMMETRHTYIIGLSLLFGLSADTMPSAYVHLPAWLKPLFQSGLTLATTMVVLLNAVFRIGVSHRKTVQIPATPEGADQLCQFIEEFGAQRGGRREVVARAVSAMLEFFESLIMNELAPDGLQVIGALDEHRFDFLIRYRGEPLEFPSERPDITLDDDPALVRKLSGYMLSNLADSVKSRYSGGVTEIEVHFEH
jgi:NCS2 family nucleobase:cation symporter-2